MSETPDKSALGRLKLFFAFGVAALVNLLFAGLAVVGMLVVNAIVQAWRAGEAATSEAALFGALGVIMVLVGAGFLYFAYIGAPRFLAGIERRRKKYQDRPWLLNRQWRARRVIHSVKFTAWFMWFWCLLWWGIIGFLWSVNKDEIVAALGGSWGDAIPAALPFVVGAIALLVAIKMTWQRFRYGDAVLLIDTLPGYLGEHFRGKVLARLAGRPKQPVSLSLTCGSLRSVRRWTGGRLETVWITDPLWSESASLQPTQTLHDRDRVTLPIDFALPPDLPESGHIADDPQIVWTLKVTPGSVPDRALKSTFQVPVFKRRVGA